MIFLFLLSFQLCKNYLLASYIIFYLLIYLFYLLFFSFFFLSLTLMVEGMCVL